MARSPWVHPLDSRQLRSDMMRGGLNNSNSESTGVVWNSHGAPKTRGQQDRTVSENRPDWYFREWMAHFKKRQAALVNELGWNKQKASFLWNGKQSYTRDILNEVSQWLGLEPFELLLPPARALAMRQLQASLTALAAEQEQAFAAPTTHPR